GIRGETFTYTILEFDVCLSSFPCENIILLCIPLFCPYALPFYTQNGMHPAWRTYRESHARRLSKPPVYAATAVRARFSQASRGSGFRWLDGALWMGWFPGSPE
ncbi:uncharacterized protein CCOS01_15397, partial [Colletotrichum costaricense]